MSLLLRSNLWRLAVLALLAGGAVSLAPYSAAAQLVPRTQAEEAPVAEQEHLLSARPLPDSLLERRLRDIYAHISAFRDVRVDVRSGVAHLRGKTINAEDRRQAEVLARRLEDIAYVENEIEAETDVQTRLTPALKEARTLLRGAMRYLPLAGVALLVMLLAIGLAALVYRWKAPYRRLGLNPLVGEWIRRLLRIVVIVCGIVAALRILDATALAGALLGSAGIAGLALGFAFQDIVENYLAGALLSLRQPFASDDLVVIGEHEGRVVRLTAREVVLMTLDGNHVSLPNSTVFKSVVTNLTRNPRRRFGVEVGIGVDEDPPQAMRVGSEALKAMQGVLRRPAPFAQVQEIGDSSVLIHFFGWVDQREADFLKVRSKAVRVLKAALDAAGIELPEPIYSIKMRSPSSETEPSSPAEDRADPEPAATRAAQEADRDTDISVDEDLESQIREDRATGSEENLLTDE